MCLALDTLPRSMASGGMPGHPPDPGKTITLSLKERDLLLRALAELDPRQAKDLGEDGVIESVRAKLAAMFRSA